MTHQYFKAIFLEYKDCKF